MNDTADYRTTPAEQLPVRAGQIVPHPYAYNAHGPGRRQFSVLCWRGWCDSDYRDREIAAMIGALSGTTWPASPAPARECPRPGTCDCECHDAPPPAAATGAYTVTVTPSAGEG